MLKRFVNVKDEEVGSVLLSFLYFFTLMCGYAILKPLRDAMAIEGGVKKVPWLITAGFGVMLLAVPVFSALVSRWPRRRVIPLVYRFFLFNLLGFFVLLKLGVVEREWVARAFFVWVGVYNLFVVSIFWSFMADLFSTEQGRRLFGFIAAGGTAGMIVGPLLATTLVGPLGPVNLMLLSVALLEGSAWCVWLLSRRAAVVQPQAAAGEAPVGGSIFAGLRLLATSPFLLLLGLQTVLYTLTSTFLYFQQLRLIEATANGLSEYTAISARIDLWVQLLTLGLQTVVTGRLMPRLGLAATLSIVPVLTVLGFLGLAALPTLGVLIGFKALRGASHYAFERPGREVLFTSLDREAKYKSKSFIDTVVYRASDTVSSWLNTGLAGLGLGMVGLSLAAVPMAALWIAVSVWLARHQRPAAPAEPPPLARTADATR
ncbi:NTP/NDP exchange transporter [Archangium lansingense]|uniref:MFS transporter n=1 Tax=Archangium lansingense TaxID=2995310 RepID=A0ABT3ZYC9_9BACT|nr:MFS transporter [Archangium lansinium]MCY1073702.1 MFS transporter [Archangium lansinium]